MADPVTAPAPPSAFPDPVHLPVAPHGDPDAARALAGAYRNLADDLDATARRVQAISTELATRWHGTGAHALTLPAATIAGNTHTLTAALRTAAGHLDDYASALHHAQHHHGWSLTKIAAVGAVITVTAVAVVVTVGAAAPVGTVAAVEIGEAIAGAEAAAGAATAAETAATTGLSLAGQAMTALRTLQLVALPHLTQGVIATTIDTTLHLATGRRITATDLATTFTEATLVSGSTAATRAALHGSEVFSGGGTATRAALDTAALTATLGADDALQQYATTGHLNPTALTEHALIAALLGGNAAGRGGTPTGALGIAARRPTGQTLDELRAGIDLRAHEGAAPYGHTLLKHVGRTKAWLQQRLDQEPWHDEVSSFTDVATAENAINQAIKANPGTIADLMSGAKSKADLRVSLPRPAGYVLSRNGSYRETGHARVRLKVVNGNLVAATAYLE